MSEYHIYKHTSPSGKVYIGMTKQKPEDRWQNGRGYRTQQRFYRAIVKYGWDAFRHEVILSGLSFEAAEEAEKRLIVEYRSRDKRFGYNTESGGNAQKEVSQETILKSKDSRSTEEYRAKMREVNTRRWSDPKAHEEMSRRLSGKNNPMYGSKLSEEHKKALLVGRLAAGTKPLFGEENPFYGKHHSKETKAKISSTRFGSKNWRAKSVLCEETGVIYPCIRDAYRATGIGFDGISKCCLGKGKTAGGYHWKYYEEV